MRFQIVEELLRHGSRLRTSAVRTEEARLTLQWTNSEKHAAPAVLDRVQRRSQRSPCSSRRPPAAPPGLALSDRVEAENGAPDDWRSSGAPPSWVSSPSCRSASGASLPSSPFKLEAPGTWFFGEGSNRTNVPAAPGVVAVYGGMILFIRVWFGLVQTLRYRPGAPSGPWP